MQLLILAGGRAKAAPETERASAYLAQFAPLARRLGLAAVRLDEVDERKAGQADHWLTKLPPGAFLIALDETGENLSSTVFAKRLKSWIEARPSALVFAIGAADGLPDAVKRAAGARLAFGQATWPHMLVRVMLTEQLYRAGSILTGHPYHRA